MSEIMLSQPPPAYNAQCVGGDPVDVDAKGEVWRCYGLYSLHRATAGQFDSFEEMERYFARRVRLLEHLHLFEECGI